MMFKKIFQSIRRHSVKTNLLVSLLLLFLVSTVQASVEEMVTSMSLEQLLEVRVESAAFFTESASLSPGSVYIIDVPKATRGAVRTTRDILYMDAPGVIVQQHARHGTLVGMRGVWIDNNAKSMFMLDGQQLNPRTHFGYTVGMQSPLLGDIQRLEVVRGPGAIRHGAGAINGVMNYIPKTGTQNPGGFASVEYGGKENLYRAETGYGTAFGPGRDLYLYAGVFDAQGFVDDYSARGYDWNPDLKIDPSTRVHGQKRPGVRMSAYLNQGELSWNTFYQEITPSSNADAYTKAQYFHSAVFGTRPKITHSFSRQEELEVSAGLTLMEHGREELPESWNQADSGGSEAHVNLETIFRTTRFDGHRLALGTLMGYRRFSQKEQYFQSDYDENFEAVNMRWKEWSLFAEDQYEILDNLIITAGVRYDYELHDDRDYQACEESMDNLSYRITAAMALDKNMVIKADYQQGFRTPDANYYATIGSLNQKANKIGQGNVYALKPETMDSWSLSLINEMLGRKLHTELTGFYNQYHDLLKWGNYKDVLAPGVYADLESGYGADSLYGFLNTPQGVRTWGMESSCMARIFDNTEVKASYTYTRTSEEAANTYPYPRHMGKLGLGQYFFGQDLYVNLAAVYHQGKGWSRDQESFLTARNRIQVDGSAAYQLTQNLRVKVLIQNLFKEDVPPAVNYIPREGGLGYAHRFWYLSLDYKF